MNMTSDHNQQSRPSIFGDHSVYPQPNSDWNRFTPNSDLYTQQNFPFCSNFGSAPVTFPMPNMQDKCATNYLSQVPTFPSTSQYNYGNRLPQVVFRCKRKTESPLTIASKQHITEEKMAEHLSKLHISSETPPATSYEAEENRMKRLYMCDEMLKLQTESILPKSILNNIQRPCCTALVLWTPPQRLQLQQQQQQQEDENLQNNNEEQVPDHNLMELDAR